KLTIDSRFLAADALAHVGTKLQSRPDVLAQLTDLADGPAIEPRVRQAARRALVQANATKERETACTAGTTPLPRPTGSPPVGLLCFVPGRGPSFRGARPRGLMAEIPVAEGAPTAPARENQNNRADMAAKKILMLVGDFVEDYEAMVPFQALQMVGFTVQIL